MQQIEGPVFSKAARDLAIAMSERGWGRKKAATEVGCDISMLRRWLNGQRIPELKHVVRMEVLFGIPSGRWLERVCSETEAA